MIRQWEFYNANLNQVTRADAYQASLAEAFLKDPTKPLGKPGFMLQYPPVIKHPQLTGKPLIPPDLQLCIFIDDQKKSCVFTAPKTLDLKKKIKIEQDYIFTFTDGEAGETFKFTDGESNVLYNWIVSRKEPYPQIVLLRYKDGAPHYCVFNYPKSIEDGYVRVESYRYPPAPNKLKTVGVLKWKLKTRASKWSGTDNVKLRRRLDDWIKNESLDLEYGGNVTLNWPARITYDGQTWRMQAGDYRRERTYDLFLMPQPPPIRGGDPNATPEFSPYYIKYKGMPDELSKVVYEWAKQQSDVSKHDVFINWYGNVYALHMPRAYDPTKPIKAYNIDTKIRVSIVPVPLDLYDPALEPPSPARGTAPPQRRDPSPAAPPPARAAEAPRRNPTPKLDLPDIPVIYVDEPRPAPPPEKSLKIRLRKIPAAAPKPPTRADAPLRKRDLREYQARERPPFVSPYSPNTSLVVYDNTNAVDILKIQQASANSKNRFEQWIQTGSANLNLGNGLVFVYPAQIGKFSKTSTRFHMYAVSAVNELEMIHTQNIPLLVLGERDTGENIVYRWTNGNEFSRIESQAIYKWKNGREFMHQIMYVTKDQESITYIFDYATNTAMVHIPGVDPYKIEFQLESMLLKRGKFAECSICAQPALLKCLCSKAFYCTEACAAKDEEQHKHC
jgi:hypothetical protein